MTCGPAYINKDLRDTFNFSNGELLEGLNRITDHFTDLNSIGFSGDKAIVFPDRRAVIDLKPISENSQEPMTQKGMRII